MPKTKNPIKSDILFVDLDDTLVETDTLFDSILLFIKKTPFNLFNIFYWLLLGKTVLKHEIACRVTLNLDTLPYNKSVIDYIISSKKNGQKVVLATATNLKTARSISDHLKFFDDVIASDINNNLKGQKKLNVIQEYVNNKDFDYIGDSKADIPIFNAAQKAIISNPTRSLASKYRDTDNVLLLKKKKMNKFLIWLKAIRLHQWSKNTLLFLPLIMAHRFEELEIILNNFLSFILFGLVASAGYIFNDLNDLDSDRKHPSKKERPYASGDMSIKSGLVSIVLLLAIAFSLSLLYLEKSFSFLLILYLFSTILYSLFLKKEIIIDVIVLSILYVLRIIAGGVSTGTPVSSWLLVFSIFFFSSLAFMKRYTDVVSLKKKTFKLHGRNYQGLDAGLILTAGLSSGYISILVLALYIFSSNVNLLYQGPEILLIILPLLFYWISRLWLLSHRGEMNSDPIIFSIKDKVSYMILFFVLVVCFFAKNFNFQIFQQ